MLRNGKPVRPHLANIDRLVAELDGHVALYQLTAYAEWVAGGNYMSFVKRANVFQDAADMILRASGSDSKMVAIAHMRRDTE